LEAPQYSPFDPFRVAAHNPSVRVPTLSRREFVTLGRGVSALARDPKVGLIFPPLNYPIPPDAKRGFGTVFAKA
jgi:hypothetical protein